MSVFSATNCAWVALLTPDPDEKSAQTDDQTVDSSSLVELDAKDGLPQKDHVADPTSRPVTMTAASGTVIGHTQSLPQLPPARPRAESRVGRASEEFNALMKEVLDLALIPDSTTTQRHRI